MYDNDFTSGLEIEVPVSEGIVAYLPDIIAKAEKLYGNRAPGYQDPTVDFVSDERAP